ncbi:thioredoxin domain-containing protein [Candidatus Saccharibacteria bacterium]|nr:thioredoxin domain-containing protein [Candidatus Saccharibacteria bacterium]
MKKGFSIAGVIAGIAAVALLGVLTFLVIDGNNKATKYEEYDFWSVIGPTDNNGQIADFVKGSPDAKVFLFEFADYQCPLCATVNPRVNQLIEKYEGKLAVVLRTYLLPYHQNATAAASASIAAGLQGYWKAYSDALFANQAEWEYADTKERTELFKKYFEEITEGQGDLAKFEEDLKSPAVSKKVSFDQGIGKRIELPGTPAFYLDGKLINFGAKEGDSFTVGDQTFTWDEPQVNDDFSALMTKIIDAKLAE